jgi:hypothetical protein
VEALGGAECPVAIGSSAAWASYFHSERLAIDSTGKLYTWTYVSPGGLVSSIDAGDSYTAINTTPSLFNSMQVDPFDDDHLVAVFNQHSASPIGIHHSLDAGQSWVQTDAVFEGYEGGVIFNPAAEGWIYLEGGHYSEDGALTWTTDAAFDCLEVDATGAGYRLATGGSGMELERAPDMTSPVWATLHTFTGVDGDVDLSMVSVVGSTIAVVIEGRLFISTDGGTSFAAQPILVTDGPLVASSIVAHGALLYAAANGRVFKSIDAAQSWTESYAPAEPLHHATQLRLNPGVNAQLIARPEDWNSTYERRLDVTLDGGGSWSSTSDCCYGWAGVLALGPADPSRVFFFGYEPAFSSDGGLTFSPTGSGGSLIWDPWPQAFVDPGDSDFAWYGEDNGRLYEYARLTNNATQITSRLPFTNPAGMDMVEVAGTWQLRVISRTGEIAISEDRGLTFTAVAGSGGLPSEARRVFVSHPDTPELIATGPLLGSDVAFSPVLGTSWVEITLASCEIRGLALTDGELLIPCDSEPAVAIDAP